VIRVVLAVLVAVALLAASAPAIETARAAATADRLGAEADRFERAVGAVVAGSTPVADPELAPRTTVAVRVPTGFAAADLDSVALVETGGAADGGGLALAYRTEGGPERTIRVGTGPTPAAVEVDGGRVRLRSGGVTGVRVRYVDDGGPTLRIDAVA
jgi:hypothetical protein